MTINQTLSHAAAPARQQYLSFLGASELCALPIDRVEEIIDPLTVAPVPQTPVFVKGVANLRGDVLPIVDFAALLHTAGTPEVGRQCVIVVSVQHADHTQRIGLLVDQVEAVFDLNEDQLGDAPPFGCAIDTDCIRGITKNNTRFVALLELDRLLQLEKLQPT